MMMINTGIVFGWGRGIPVWVVGIGLLGVMVVAGKTRELWGRIGLAMIAVGGGVNLYMRIVYGGVVDNLILFGVLYNNLWDYLIGGGLLLYGYSYIKELRKLGKSENPKSRGSGDKNNF